MRHAKLSPSRDACSTIGAVPKILSRIRSLARRGSAKLVVRPSVPTLHSLGHSDAALTVYNVGKAEAKSIVVAMQLRHATFEFDEIDRLPPNGSMPLTRERVSRFKIDDMNVAAANWFRIAVRAVVSDSGELRIPLAIHYVDHTGMPRARFQVLHCDEKLSMRVSDS